MMANFHLGSASPLNCALRGVGSSLRPGSGAGSQGGPQSNIPQLAILISQPAIDSLTFQRLFPYINAVNADEW